MNPIIKDILYLTHDKWKVEIKERNFFKNFLEMLIEKNPLILEDLKVLVELGNEEDKFLITQGVLNIIKENYTDDFKSVLFELHSMNKDKEYIKKVLQNER